MISLYQLFALRAQLVPDFPHFVAAQGFVNTDVSVCFQMCESHVITVTDSFVSVQFPMCLRILPVSPKFTLFLPKIYICIYLVSGKTFLDSNGAKQRWQAGLLYPWPQLLLHTSGREPTVLSFEHTAGKRRVFGPALTSVSSYGRPFYKMIPVISVDLQDLCTRIRKFCDADSTIPGTSAIHY